MIMMTLKVVLLYLALHLGAGLAGRVIQQRKVWAIEYAVAAVLWTALLAVLGVLG